MLMARLTSSKLNRGNAIVAINPRPVSLVRYSTVILKRIKKNESYEQEDTKNYYNQ